VAGALRNAKLCGLLPGIHSGMSHAKQRADRRQNKDCHRSKSGAKTNQTPSFPHCDRKKHHFNVSLHAFSGLFERSNRDPRMIASQNRRFQELRSSFQLFVPAHFFVARQIQSTDLKLQAKSPRQTGESLHWFPAFRCRFLRPIWISSAILPGGDRCTAGLFRSWRETRPKKLREC
jgi:hypothetical protein